MTDTRQDTQKAAGELQGRARRGQRGREGERAHGTAAPEHTTGAGEEDKRREGRKENRRERDTDGRAPGEWWRGARRRHTAAGREQTDRKKEYVIFKGEKRGKTPLRLAKACKCVYIHITQYRGV